jgi:antitoxin FitA
MTRRRRSVTVLKRRATRRSRSAEQEHRETLQGALQGPRRKALADVLTGMPNVGEDDDFARHEVDRRN